MKFRFALLVGLLLAASIQADLVDDSSSSTTTELPTTPPATSTATPPETSPPTSTATAPADGTTATPVTTDTPPTDASTASPGSTVSPGSTASPGTGTTVPPVTGGSDATTVPVTVGGSTVSSGPTTTGPLPNVTYSLVQFGLPVCVDATCTYEIQAPTNNQAVLATDQSLVSDERSQFAGLQVQADEKDSRVKQANDDAAAKIATLQKLMDSIQSQLDSIKSNIVVIQNQQNDASATMSLVENFITDIGKSQDNCLYQRCLKPTTPAPPTTTPTPAPTTTPSPCLTFDCPDATADQPKCTLDNSNKPFCNYCPGNMDGYTRCQTVACTSGTLFHVDSSGNGTWYSAGYNPTSPGNSTVPANANCVYNLKGKFQTDNTMSLACLTSTKVTLTFSSSDGGYSQIVNSGTSLRSLNSLLGKIPDGTITLTSTASDQSFCVIPLIQVPSSAMLDEIPEKKNGFFSWLMGY
ncbi:hypothetical protein GCK72_010861 [Caenorhabditis remanei]|uniref:CUB domain-containing protein n=1 Tax=Caenorhabditis remanei TaxID=31234 RepID=A0A6A5H6A6_CAERE|nr:hypothetical protein GCK72_010861 [Caenorhabditis remanei]KAF1762599.1 hypothetical protein GCK72_010861 [Caenorhabditis remanei]